MIGALMDCQNTVYYPPAQTEEIIENALNSEKVIKGNQNLIAFTD